jgi:ABC-type transporter MlaC component
VYDVAVDGVGLVSSYRSQFNSILRTASFGELLERLRDMDAKTARAGQGQ